MIRNLIIISSIAYIKIMITRSGLKLSLVDDYIQIMLITNFCNNDFSIINEQYLFNKIQTIKNGCNSLKTIYNKMFTLLKLNNASFAILNQQLTLNNSQFEKEKKENFINLVFTFKHMENILYSININLNYKLKKLKLDKYKIIDLQ